MKLGRSWFPKKPHALQGRYDAQYVEHIHTVYVLISTAFLSYDMHAEMGLKRNPETSLSNTGLFVDKTNHITKMPL